MMINNQERKDLDVHEEPLHECYYEGSRPIEHVNHLDCDGCSYEAYDTGSQILSTKKSQSQLHGFP